MRNIKLFSLKWSLSEWCFMHCYTIYYGQWTFFANVTSTLGTKKKIVCPCSQEICIMPAAQNPWTAAIVDKTGYFFNCKSFPWPWLKSSSRMSIRLFSAGLALHTWPTVNTRVCASDSWLMLCHVREQDPDLRIGTASRAPHHNAAEPSGTDPNRANGSRSWAPNRPSVSLSAPVSSSDPNANWHLINILSEGFISLTSRCLFSFSPLKTMDALITQNSICVRERDPRPARTG